MMVAEAVFEQVDPELRLAGARRREGGGASRVSLAEVVGPAAAIITAERVALNFLGRLSKNRHIDRSLRAGRRRDRRADSRPRKTTPGLQALEREAVRARRRAGATAAASTTRCS